MVYSTKQVAVVHLSLLTGSTAGLLRSILPEGIHPQTPKLFATSPSGLTISVGNPLLKTERKKQNTPNNWESNLSDNCISITREVLAEEIDAISPICGGGQLQVHLSLNNGFVGAGPNSIVEGIGTLVQLRMVHLSSKTRDARLTGRSPARKSCAPRVFERRLIQGPRAEKGAPELMQR